MTRLIVISSEKDPAMETELVNDLFESGLELFHLRKPAWNIEQQRSFFKKIKGEFLSMISIHQHHETISEFNLKYCHVKENDRKGLKKINGLKYSTSFHNYSDLQFESHFWDYCFLSPVFDSISKTDYKSKLGNDFNIEGDLYQRVFALGGVTKNNVKDVFRKEFYGAAVLGAIWSNPENAVTNFKEIKEKCRSNVHTY
jgi:thiamine-phosphate pyrophosphorylase